MISKRKFRNTGINYHLHHSSVISILSEASSHSEINDQP
ncbi:hypothetical protein LEP1GSC193_0911 [Leptospira alstonii serovar Pingchang str. 80-412]|uniref:Uncharacterized protein n=2 Tax=Leptospira alstonii TaxID=28452 RepID=M6CUE4_9LEPT|nr:hypothetical protein LEP1GSC194_3689 [Leptospira alstonii serovar Sichuan str. 79601]EQA80056.1 hypothetical protein LEP1GSC193_0911 [Leptospira alstonii serovar Pingchang str. 80-412]